MAQRTKEELKQYAEGIAKEAGLDEAKTKIAIAVLTNDIDALKDIPIADVLAATQPIANLTVGRQADYSRAMNDAKQVQDRAMADYNRNKKWYDDNAPALKVATDAAAAMRDKVAKYEAEYGALDDAEDMGGGKSVTATGKVVKTADLDKLRGEIQTQSRNEMAKEFLAFEVERSRLAKAHWARFKEPLDTEELVALVAKHASDPLSPKQISLTDAHTELYGAKIAEQDVAARQAELTKAREEGKAEGRKLASAGMTRSGAALPEDGVLFAHLAAERKATADKGAVPQLSEDEASAAFNKDFDETLTAANSSATT